MRGALGVGFVMATAISCSAFAADLAVRRVPVVAAASVYNWTGFYVGVNAGGGMALGTIDDKSAFFGASDSFHRGVRKWAARSATIGSSARPCSV